MLVYSCTVIKFREYGVEQFNKVYYDLVVRCLDIDECIFAFLIVFYRLIYHIMFENLCIGHRN